ncbi:phage tailspike protein [Novosphingobium sp. MMS21-SN21R]|uniref:phage tailspike protein n=1 Tax=Novosphingobium sp. MMS21-SN21R TaxID=2969298 RepID=UPI002883B708|nr:phage tailspike protein [Novosphingobium sp. MMS21-SN21R]MDT0507537.1 phage tailspike protein [Novosphingobium sp. MMS21-SN21R]
MTARVGNPFPFFLDRSGLPLDSGSVYIGTSGDDPELSPVTVYLDAALTVSVAQPLRVIGGLICNDGNPTAFYVASSNYSMRVKDADAAEVFYVATAIIGGDEFQPLDADLTAIAALATTPFGRAVLTVASAAAMRSYIGIVDSLPLSGGVVTGNIVRSSSGSHLYHSDPTNVSGRVFVTASGAADPTSAIGDIWLELAP